MNLVVVGGGTAGWLTALYAKKVNPSAKVTLIESEEIGILGAGEGATPHLQDFLNYLGISITEFIQETDATIKNGIKFTNWSIDKSFYYHPFTSKIDASNDFNFTYSRYEENDMGFAHIYGALNNHTWKDYSLVARLSEEKKAPFMFFESGFASISPWSYHFNARKVAAFLRKKAESIGVVRIEGKVSSVTEDDLKNIRSIHVNNVVIECDFDFDCTGFARLIIGKHYQSPWRSHSKTLPAKKAIPFFIPLDKEIPPYTESIAMSCGWMWKIPTQERYGCGYVFDSDYISDEDAIKEIESYLGFEPEYAKQNKGSFVFEAGCYEQIWVNNCLAVGLSSGFIEPLEATSIMQFVRVLERFFSSPINLTTGNKTIKSLFNDQFLQDTEEVVDFVYLHYLTNREEPFWKEFAHKNKPSNFVSNLMGIIKDRPLIPDDFIKKTVFLVVNYNYVLLGNNLLSLGLLKQHALNIKNDKTSQYKDIIKKQKDAIKKCEKHNAAINTFKSVHLE